MILTSVLSDVQEMLVAGMIEEARQKINVVKYWMAACCYIKSVDAPEVEIVAAGPVPESDIPHLGDMKELIEKSLVTYPEPVEGFTRYATNASDLGFRPGNWPSFTIMLEGDKVTFSPVRDTVNGGKVYQGGGDLELFVFND